MAIPRKCKCGKMIRDPKSNKSGLCYPCLLDSSSKNKSNSHIKSREEMDTFGWKDNLFFVFLVIFFLPIILIVDSAKWINNELGSQNIKIANLEEKR